MRRPDCDRNEPMKAKGSHQIAELGLGEHPAHDDQHDELGDEAEHASAGANQKDPQIAVEPHPQHHRQPAHDILLRAQLNAGNRLIEVR